MIARFESVQRSMRALTSRPLSLGSRTLFVIGFLSLASTVRADDLNVFPDDGSRRQMLYKYLQKQAQKNFDARRATVAALRTADDVRRRQRVLKEQFIAALGGFPSKTPLNARVVRTARGDGYRIEHVIYESRPQHHVAAVFYLPDGKPPFPGVLVPCGHSANGKAAEAYQRACILMAKNGLAVLCYDPIGQGERIQLLTPEGKPVIAGSTSEHTMAGVGALLVGGSTATYRIWDGIRSLDYLAGRPEVDPERLGCTGNSGGGTLTAYLMALDERIKAAAPSCYITSLERLFATIGPQDAEQNITGQVAFGMEHADYLTMRAPLPTLVCVGTRDYFDINGAWSSFREAKLLYGMLGAGERVDLFEYNDTHGFSKPRREAAMRWMRRWLLDKNDAPTEGNDAIRSDAQMQCTRTGQVLSDFHGKSVFTLNEEREQKLAPDRAEFLQRPREEVIREIRRRLALPDSILPAARKEFGQFKKDGLSITKTIYTSEPDIELPAYELNSAKRDGRAVVYVHGEGKAAALDKLRQLAGDGSRVVAVDLRGMGETAPAGAARPGAFGVDSKEAFLALHLNRPLLGQRVFDLRAVIQTLKREGRYAIELIGVGVAGPIALHAAALDLECVTAVTVREAVMSWSAVVREPVSRNQLTIVIPGVLGWYDLPDLAAMLAPTKLNIELCVDPMNRPAPRDVVEKTFARCRQSYARRQAADHFKLVYSK